MHDALGALALAAATATPTPTPSMIDPAKVTPGAWGFVITALVAVITIVLVWDMIRRIRRGRVRADLLDELGSVPSAPVARVLGAILESTGYADWWTGRAPRNPSMDPLRNVEQLVSFAQEFDRDRQGTLQEFLEQSALLTDADKDEPDADKVTLLTIHAAKGLEFEAVVVAGSIGAGRADDWSDIGLATVVVPAEHAVR